MGDVLNAFVSEVKQEGPKGITSKWHSAHLKFHITLALHNNAFTVAHHNIALKKMNQTWAQFKEKKVYRKAFCVDVEDMCSGSFPHTKSKEDMIDTLLASMGQLRMKPSDPKNTEEAASKNGLEQKCKGHINDADHSSASDAEKGTLKLDLESDHKQIHLSSRRMQRNHQKVDEHYGKATNNSKGKERQNMAAVLFPSEDAKDELESSSDDQLDIPLSASLNVEVKGKGKGGREVAVCTALPDINEDESDSSSAIESFTDKSDVKRDIMSQMLVEVPDVESSYSINDEDLDANVLPSTLMEWNIWTRIAFEHGNTQVFVKLGTFDAPTISTTHNARP
ncbi:uncharacterized protein F5147DRAFT_652943 [Suillus discolor]|uniref:Uncharacterized protein n=1 Tax=Suillus discolor TaxID=1912936 RepID=A0A9P7F7N4_9AGAM|nr:uncharacterized protein F5147DRAFT_652943 [Suillus discolor]KAG2108221.1 hypothetical protein F5147DRAFT_652943 [Suillus discolor]